MAVVVYLFLTAVAVAIATTIWYLLKRRRDEKHAEAAAFRRVLIRTLKQTFESGTFDFASLIQLAGISRALSMTVACDVYASTVRRAATDGVITDKENSNLLKLANALGISEQQRRQIETQAKGTVYSVELGLALADGHLDRNEANALEDLRQSLGLSRIDVANAVGGSGKDAYRAEFRRIVQSGQIDETSTQSLKRLSSAAGLSDDAAYAAIRRDALQVFRECFIAAKQDGRITQEEESRLFALQRMFGIPESDISSYRHEIAQIRFMDDCRNGKLPVQKTAKLLEGGEICHWDSACMHVYETRTKSLEVRGEITITSQRIMFVGPIRSFEISASRVVDIRTRSDGVAIQTSVSRGTGFYFLRNAALFAAILEGVVRKHKYLAAESFSDTQSRHIPDRVKQAVWARDAGKCIKCSADDYLEFDHIIPHSHGGANTENNVQLLCRRCNGLKSDRIG